MKFLRDLGHFIMPTLHKSPAELEAEATRRDELGRAIERKVTFESLQRHTGWIAFEQMLATRRSVLFEELLQETDVTVTKAKIAELDAVRRMVSDAVQDGQTAQAELDGMDG